MRQIVWLCVALSASAFQLSPAVQTSPTTRAISRAAGALRMGAEYDEYIKSRGQASIDAAQTEYRKFKSLTTAADEFDGGDSGGGVVGDGNTDLEDQHNSPSIVRGGFGQATVADGGSNVGRGSVLSQDTVVKGATEARVASARGNYFGRTTGYADKFMEKYDDKDFKEKRIDHVRAQQMENWNNQNSLNAANRQSGQGVMFGKEVAKGGLGASNVRNRAGAYDANAASSDTDAGLDISQADLANHLTSLAAVPTERLDGEDWGPVSTAGAEVEATYEMRATVGGVEVQDIKVANLYNTFAPYRVALQGAAAEFSVTPNAGSMNRRAGAPIELTVRFNPKAYGEPRVATLIFETEDFKKIFNLIGST